MTNNDFNTEIRSGALACIDAMKIIEQIAESGASYKTIGDCFTAQRVAISSAILAAGDIPERAQGVIAAMAEYIYMCNSAGTPNLKQWRPEASMTENEKTVHMASYINADELEITA
jgi:hypothetical protein